MKRNGDDLINIQIVGLLNFVGINTVATILIMQTMWEEIKEQFGTGGLELILVSIGIYASIILFEFIVLFISVTLLDAFSRK